MDVCGLADLGYTGIPWTFEKKVAGGTYCRVRLDRALASPCWSARYPMAEVKHLASTAMSDHLPILLELEPREPREQRHQHVFRYETMWESHSDFDRMLAQAWAVQTEGEPLQALQSKMLDVSGALSVWGKETFGHVRSEIKKLKRELDRMRTEPTRVGPSYEETKVRANRRRKKNKIEKLKKSDGSMTEDVQELKTLSRNFYIDLYTSEETTGMEEVLAAVDPSVTPEMNARLLAPFDGAEIKTALFQMFPTKAPGPDGFPAYFFQRHWDLCGEEVTKVVLKILNGEDSPEIINNTFIVLIPKVARPEELGQFRPISLCNVIYKIASKVLANRPKRNAAKKHQHCALKLDMRKAYDRVEWNYLKAIMLRMGFHGRWVSLIMRLVSSVSFSVLFNGTPLESFRPSREIRQGDPISPYLFLIAAEGLSGLLKKSRQSLHLQGIQVAPSAPAVNHLLFADDSQLFVKASTAGARDVTEILKKYCDASGQRINLDKSSVFFSKGCPEVVRQSVKGILQVPNETLNEKYLGMPSDVGRSLNGAFKYLKDRAWRILQNPETLSARILKAVYFPTTCFLEASVGSHPSQDLGQDPGTKVVQRRQVCTLNQPKWIAPPVGMVKLNADAAVAKTGNGGALAVVCRSEAGEFLGASALTLNVGYSPATLEAMACREALALAQDLNIQKICVASDCLEVIKNLTQPYDGGYGAVIREIKDTTTLFQSVVFKHEARASNGEAHRLARSSICSWLLMVVARIIILVISVSTVTFLIMMVRALSSPAMSI
ncbi:uncharacterized protein [Lolium perenne]|uniref:uncharacterized protein n=1 Tax=Lolium perenne TaxID=4522 RepID=UPI003A994530